MPDHAIPHPDVAGYVLGALEPIEAEQFSAHLRGCDHCRSEVAELASLRTVLDRAMPAPVLPPNLAERTFAAIEQAARDSAARRTGPAPAAPLRQGRRTRRVGPIAAALAGVAALVTGLVLMTDSSPPTRQVVLLAADGGAARGVVHLHREDAGVVIELAVRGLPVPPEGSFYECWYVAGDDTPDHPARVTAGTFTVAPAGTTEVQMTTAAGHELFPGIEVTLEPGDGDPRRTGPAVLRSAPTTHD
ncbi:MAG TPA: anti-sigma factor [Acidimicrobiales bacterium]|nr:anti-sigma factor [Acidimicrobiales bacterium]